MTINRNVLGLRYEPSLFCAYRCSQEGVFPPCPNSLLQKSCESKLLLCVCVGGGIPCFLFQHCNITSENFKTYYLGLCSCTKAPFLTKTAIFYTQILHSNCRISTSSLNSGYVRVSNKTHRKMASAVSLTLKLKQATQHGKVFDVCRININRPCSGYDCFSCPPIYADMDLLLTVLFILVWIDLFLLPHFQEK